MWSKMTVATVFPNQMITSQYFTKKTKTITYRPKITVHSIYISPNHAAEKVMFKHICIIHFYIKSVNHTIT